MIVDQLWTGGAKTYLETCRVHVHDTKVRIQEWVKNQNQNNNNEDVGINCRCWDDLKPG